MTPAEQEIARSAIRHVMSIYNNCGDRGQLDEMLTAFALDGVMEIPGDELVGVEAIRAFMTSRVARADLLGSRHNLTTSRIEIDGPTEAHAWTYFIVTRQGKVLQEGTYIDRFALTDSGWRIARRRVKMLFNA